MLLRIARYARHELINPSLPGFEPGTFGLEVQRAIHCATGTNFKVKWLFLLLHRLTFAATPGASWRPLFTSVSYQFIVIDNLLRKVGTAIVAPCGVRLLSLIVHETQNYFLFEFTFFAI